MMSPTINDIFTIFGMIEIHTYMFGMNLVYVHIYDLVEELPRRQMYMYV
jgi:hypothetical protein